MMGEQVDRVESDGGGSIRGAAGISSRDGVLQRAFAVFMGLHGIVHVIGFTVPWRLGGPKGLEYSTSLLNGSIEVGDLGVKLLGLVWLATTLAFLIVAVLLWRRSASALPSTVAVVAVSLGLCLVDLPGSIIGLVIDLVVLGLLVAISDRLVARPIRTR